MTSNIHSCEALSKHSWKISLLLLLIPVIQMFRVRLWGFMSEVVENFHFLSARFSSDYLSDVTKKILSRDLIDVLLPVRLYRSLYSNRPRQDVLCRVKKMCVPPAVKSFFFKHHCTTLFVKVWKRRKGIFVPVKCTLYKNPRTVWHAFTHCWNAEFLGRCSQMNLKKELYINSHTISFLHLRKPFSVPYDNLTS